MTISNTPQKRKKDAGEPGNGGQYAGKTNDPADITLESDALVALRARVAEDDRIAAAAVDSAAVTAASALDQTVALLFPAAVTAVVIRDYSEGRFRLEELRDAADNDIAVGGDAGYAIDGLAARLGTDFSDYLGELTEVDGGEAVEWKVGETTVKDTPARTVAVIDLEKPDLSGIPYAQMYKLQTELINRTGTTGPVTDRGEAYYRLFDELEHGLDTPEEKAALARHEALAAELGGRGKLAEAVTQTQAWENLGEMVVEALADERLGTRATVFRALDEIVADRK